MSWLQKKVGRTRRRYLDENWDIDLTYICQDRIVVMSFPAVGTKTLWRNDATEVKRFFDERHAGKYWVFNCSESTYDASRFDGRVSNYNW